MEITFIDYQQNIFAEAIDSEKAKVYVFDNFQNMKKAQEYYQKPFLKKESLFITMVDLKEKLFPTGKLILKEEKLAIFFYELLTEEEKERLGIENYFDSIDISAKFFKFYKELNEYNVLELIGLKNWQQEKYKIFQAIRERYCKKIEELNYTDSTLAFDFRYFDDYFLLEYNDLVFVNIINFTPKERDLVDKIVESSYNIQLYLQLNEKDYDQNNLRIQSFSLPKESLTDINLYHTDEDLLQVVNLLANLNEKDYEKDSLSLLDADFTNSNYQDLLSSDRILLDKETSFTESQLYNFLENLYDLAANADLRQGDLQLEIKTLLDFCYHTNFRNYYGLSIDDIKTLQIFAAADYVYISSRIINISGNRLENFKGIFEDIKYIYQIKNLQEFVGFLEKIDFKKLNDSRFTNNISQYFDGLLEIYTIEEMDIVSSWNSYFPNRALGLFRLILNYLRYKQLKLIPSNEKDSHQLKATIQDLKTASHSSHADLYIINASKGIIPSESNDSFILTEKQRGEVGLKTSEMVRLEEKYYFFRHILSSKRTVIYNLENLEENISSSPFVDELILEYGLDNKEMKIKAEHYPFINRKIFNRREENFSNIIFSEIKEKDKLILEKCDFQEYFPLAYYKYGVLKTCYFKFFLENIAKLKEEQVEINKELSPKFLGIIVHELFADIFEKANTDLKVDKEWIKVIVENKLRANYLKINKYYKKYYQEIFFPKIENSIMSFFAYILRRINGQIRNVLSEWEPEGRTREIFYQNEICNIYLNGRIDLLIKTDEASYVIDFKTGLGDISQLDFYSLLFNPDLTPDFRIEKAIYAVLDEKFEFARVGTEAILAEDIKDTLNDFFQGEEYSFEYKPSVCDKCIMIDICRVV